MRNQFQIVCLGLLLIYLVFPSATVLYAQAGNVAPSTNLKLNTKPQLRPETIPGTNENLRVRMEQLENEVQSLDQTVKGMERRLEQLSEELAEIRKLATPPICKDFYHSVRPGTGVSVSCSPYSCEKSSGLCRTRCTSTQDCAPGHVCDSSFARCIPNPNR